MVTEILARGRLPLLVGGTMHYRALVAGLDNLPPADRKCARKSQLMPHNAAGAHCMRNSRHRSVNRRACETHRPAAHPARWKWRITGRPLSALQNASSPALPFELKTFAIVPADRAQLHQRIAARFDSLLKAGLIEEVKALRMRYELSAGLPSMRAVGYRQVWEYLEGAYGHEALREKGIAATRQLAKRQMTWLRSLRARYDILDPVDAAAQFAARLRVGQRRIAGADNPI